VRTNFAALPARHMVHQGKVAASMGNTAVQALLQRFRPQPPRPLSLPGKELTARVLPRPPALVRDYVRHVGGDPAAYARTIPPHMFPQWTFPLAAQTLAGLPYPLLKVINTGCRLTVNAPLPAGEVLDVRARLESVEDDGHRVLLRQRIVTGTSKCPDAIVAELYLTVATGNGAARVLRKPAVCVPPGARELAFWKLGPDAGLAFAMLTGDFNPIHWVRPYARAFGFASPVLHGFATMARTMEGLHRGLYAGAINRIGVLGVRFTRPLLLPARVGLYLDGRDITVGDAPGGPAYMVGQFEEKTA
jgi:acyl dehydratase